MKGMNRIAVFMCMVSACRLFGQSVGGASFFDQIVSDWHVGVTADAMQSFSIPSDIHGDGRGTLGVYKTAGTLKFQSFSEKSALDVAAGFEYSRFDFSEMPVFSDAEEMFIDLFYSRKVSDRWSAFAVVHGAMASETGADIFDGGRIFAGGGIGYAFSRNLTAGLGAMAVSRMDNTWLPLPVGYVRWTITPRWSLRTFNGAAVVCDVFEDSSLLLSAACEYNNTYLRLSDSPDGKKRSVGDNVVNISVGATYNIGKNFYVSGAVGANVYRKLIFRRGGISAEEYSSDPSPVFFLHAGCKF